MDTLYIFNVELNHIYSCISIIYKLFTLINILVFNF